MRLLPITFLNVGLQIAERKDGIIGALTQTLSIGTLSKVGGSLRTAHCVARPVNHRLGESENVDANPKCRFCRCL